MESSGFDTRTSVVFIATAGEIAAALPGWRRLSPSDKLAWQPEAPRPASLPFEHVRVPRRAEDWEARYLALDLALEGDPARAPWDDEYQDVDWEELDKSLRRRRLIDEPLSAGGDVIPYDPLWLYLVPRRMTEKLAAITPADLPAVLAEWNARSPSKNAAGDLEALSKLAAMAIASERDMYAWLRHPTLR